MDAATVMTNLYFQAVSACGKVSVCVGDGNGMNCSSSVLLFSSFASI